MSIEAGILQQANNKKREALSSQWSQIYNKFSKEFGAEVAKSWLGSLTIGSFDNGVLILIAPSFFIRDWVNNNYGNRLRFLWKEINPDFIDLEIIASETNYDQMCNTSSESETVIELKKDSQITGFALDPKLTFENFIVGKPNELAYAAARRVADCSKVAFNPLFLYGGVGLGKTHLMHSIAWYIQKSKEKRRVIYMSAERFMYQFIRAVRFKDTMTFKDQFRSVDVLMIDDIQFICGKDSTQEEFFHTFNTLVDNNRQVIISADKSPSALEGMEERMKSRLGWGLVADIHPTTYELRLGILQLKAKILCAKVPQKVLEFLSHKITSNVRELEGALNRIVAHSTLIGREITLESTQEVLRDLLRSCERRVTVEEIQRKVADHYSVRVSDMHSPRRLKQVTLPRQIAMFLSKQLTTMSLPEIGRKFGGRDHTTVLHAVKKIDELTETNPSVEEDIHLLRKMLT